MKAFTHFLSVLSMLCCLAAPARAETVTVFAAASLKTALDEIAQVYQRDHGGQMITVFAGSAALARQIQNGAPADLFISANPGWVDVLEADGLLHPENRTDLLTNRLVLIAPEGAQSGALEPSLRALPPEARLAVATTNAVPAGIYAKAALTSLGLWDALRPRLAQTDNVRAALRLVALKETPLGIVYATDAMAEPRVQVIAPFPADLHPPILYPMALITPGARPAFDFLTGPSARAIFARHGFGAPK